MSTLPPREFPDFLKQLPLFDLHDGDYGLHYPRPSLFLKLLNYLEPFYYRFRHFLPFQGLRLIFITLRSGGKKQREYLSFVFWSHKRDQNIINRNPHYSKCFTNPSHEKNYNLDN